PELEKLEDLHVQAGSLLPEQHRGTHGEPDGGRDDGADHKDQRSRHEAGDDVDHALAGSAAHPSAPNVLRAPTTRFQDPEAAIHETRAANAPLSPLLKPRAFRASFDTSLLSQPFGSSAPMLRALPGQPASRTVPLVSLGSCGNIPGPEARLERACRGHRPHEALYSLDFLCW